MKEVNVMKVEEFRKIHMFGKDFVVFEKRKYFYVWKANGAIPSDVTKPCSLPGFATFVGKFKKDDGMQVKN